MLLNTKKTYRKIKFKSAKFKEISSFISNPERGFYQIYTFKLGCGISLDEREYTFNQMDTLAFVLVDISEYKDQLLDEIAIDDLRDILDFFKEYRLSVILRITYDTEGKCEQNEPLEEELVLSHIHQLAPILKEYSDIIFVYQGILIGNWGEMHSSKFISPSRLKKLSGIFLDALKDVSFFTVRRPSYVRILFPEGEDRRQRRVGVFDDAILASPTHLGTFASIADSEAKGNRDKFPKEELAYISDLSDRVPYGGEALWSDEKDSLSRVRGSLRGIAKYFKAIHVTYLNRVYDNRFIDRLKAETWRGMDVFNGMNGYDYIERHLGYRLVIRKITCVVLDSDPEFLRWDFTFENVGFARAFFETTAVLNGLDEMGKDLSLDISDGLPFYQIASGETRTFTCITDRIYGDIYLDTSMKANGRIFNFANDRSNAYTYYKGFYIGTVNG